MNKIYAAMALVIFVSACSDSVAPDKNARHLGSTLTVSACAGGFNISTNWADGSYKAEFFSNGKSVATVNATSRATINSGCVYHSDESAFVRFTPVSPDLQRYLDVTDSKNVLVH